MFCAEIQWILRFLHHSNPPCFNVKIQKKSNFGDESTLTVKVNIKINFISQWSAISRIVWHALRRNPVRPSIFTRIRTSHFGIFSQGSIKHYNIWQRRYSLDEDLPQNKRQIPLLCYVSSHFTVLHPDLVNFWTFTHFAKGPFSLLVSENLNVSFILISCQVGV